MGGCGGVMEDVGGQEDANKVVKLAPGTRFSKANSRTQHSWCKVCSDELFFLLGFGACELRSLPAMRCSVLR